MRIRFRVPTGTFAVAYLEERPGGWLVGWSTGGMGHASHSRCLNDRGTHRPTRYVALDAARLEMLNVWLGRGVPRMVASLAEPFDVEELIDVAQ